jgi:hypothetical protein
VHRLGYAFATAALIASSRLSAEAPVRVNVSQLMDDKLALHGVTVATASSGMKLGKWSVSVSQSFLQDNVLGIPRHEQRVSLADVRQRVRRGFRDMTVSAQRSYKLRKHLQLDLTMSSSIPMRGPFGSNRFDHSADAMIEGDIGSTSYWAGVTQHLRTGAPSDVRKQLTEFYAGVSRDLDELTSLRATYYRGQSDERRLRPVTSMSLSLNHDLRDLGSIGLSATRSKDFESEDKRASLSLELDRLPF